MEKFYTVSKNNREQTVTQIWTPYCQIAKFQTEIEESGENH